MGVVNSSRREQRVMSDHFSYGEAPCLGTWDGLEGPDPERDQGFQPSIFVVFPGTKGEIVNQ